MGSQDQQAAELLLLGFLCASPSHADRVKHRAGEETGASWHCRMTDFRPWREAKFPGISLRDL